eukprot:TRINITY_DN55764_c0_g1_i1.p1 TRINITY_DN55764_c0_g1~~TRINITY_DN55764_c0_g1_i1.p1  ORF type:complete len:409 (-),score=48.98 TRINITY_DN55764_c0_g1_i1:25-1185(-)
MQTTDQDLIMQGRTPLNCGPTPSFPEFNDEARAYLDANGYCVIDNVLSEEDRNKALDLMWQWLEGIGTGISRHNWKTWDNHRWPGPYTDKGIVANGGVGQCAFMWYLRTHPGVRQIFERLWGTDKLLCSFDGCGIFRPTCRVHEWRTKQGWFHVDQNFWGKPGFQCVQGLATLFDVTPETGGFVCIPGSHLLHEESCRAKKGCRRNADFVRISTGDPLLEREAKMVTCRAGSFVLWDSRTIHCNGPSIRPKEDATENELLRAVGYVCMTPQEKADEYNLKKKVMCFINNDTSTHWPHEINQSASGAAQNLPAQDVSKLDPLMCQLIGIEGLGGLEAVMADSSFRSAQATAALDATSSSTATAGGWTKKAKPKAKKNRVQSGGGKKK